MAAGRILIVEDEDKLRRVVQLHLESAGFEVDGAPTAEQAMPLATVANLIITDLRLPGMDGLQLIQQLQARGIPAGVIVITAHGSVETAVEAMKLGAADFLQKPFSLDHLATVVQKAMAVQALRAENLRLREQLDQRYQFDNIVGRSASMREIFHTVERVAPTRTTVLLAGESGVGKDMIARAIHQHSPRKNHSFVKINCTAIPENLMESELFGYEKGAFTGATTSKPGKFEQADQGTVFLDEIGDVPGNIQVKLLRILQERQFERLGSNVTRNVDVRVIAATNVDLRAALEEGRFREDLYYRLNVVPISIPPLRERKEDIPFLAMHFVQKLSRDLGTLAKEISPAAMDKLVAHAWPGNVRELENTIERSLVLASSEVLQPADIRLEPPRNSVVTASQQAPLLPEGETLEHWEQMMIREALRRANGNKSQAARMLGLTRNALRYRLSQMGMENGAQDESESVAG
ncbi:MAG TPA: sigma-54 dependent transcriptional regulator [Bryobacteraceae bacterium]|jgi:DNA-binding NtrC family response regulator|nr:sigma-54 dependent transcriptional regulator [Bryobacteraceae bacterium]HZU44828.1 sigma-54 dependent transcriptional regulator [Terriglobales bacterium]